MTVQTDMLQVLRSTDGQAALKKAANGGSIDALNSQAGQKALITALESAGGQKALRTALREMLRDGFAATPDVELAPISAAQGKLVHPNQKWLFDTVGNMNSLIIEVLDIVAAGKEKVPG